MLSGLWDISTGSHGRTRSITAENPTGEHGRGGRASTGTGATAARELGVGWKISPSIVIPAGSSTDLASINSSGVIRHIWLTTTAEGREAVLRTYWDGEPEPAVETPLGDFFCNGWGRFAEVTSLPIVVAPYRAMTSYWEMPFKSGARISIENLASRDITVYYQVDYSEQSVPAGAGYFHARWRRDNPVDGTGIHKLLELPSGPGLYCGTYVAFGTNSPGWWGEGELKFYIDDDEDYPSICGTGTEDYFGGAWDFDVPGQGYTVYSSPFFGMNQVIKPDGLYDSQQRFGMYRWHVLDPVTFDTGLRVTIQDLGWHGDGRYLQRRDDVASMVTWYHARPSSMPGRKLTLDEMEVDSRPRAR
jgi:Protein of unknown function (DUF2961)